VVHRSHVAAPDEDEFTLAAAALESLDGPFPTGGSALRIEVLGELPMEMEWALSAFLGIPVQVERVSCTARSLANTLAGADVRSPGSRVVLATELPSREGPKGTEGGEPDGDDGAVAFLVREGPEENVDAALQRIADAPSVLEAAFRLRETLLDRAGGGTWVGDWDRPAGRPPPSRPTGPSSPRDLLRSVSEGAYVPRPRYLENLPSRWRFVAERCRACRATTFPTRSRCRQCGRSDSLERIELPRRDALVVATTVIGPGGQPTEFDPQVEAWGPYEVVLAELAAGVRVTLQVADADPGEVRIGDRVDSGLRRLYPMEGEWRYGRKVVPRRPPALHPG
jgi:uncharacterized OB-fold protein